MVGLDIASIHFSKRISCGVAILKLCQPAIWFSAQCVLRTI